MFIQHACKRKRTLCLAEAEFRYFSLALQSGSVRRYAFRSDYVRAWIIHLIVANVSDSRSYLATAAIGEKAGSWRKGCSIGSQTGGWHRAVRDRLTMISCSIIWAHRT